MNLSYDENYFVFDCKMYERERELCRAEFERDDLEFLHKITTERLETHMKKDFAKSTAKFLDICYFKRRNVLYK